MGIKLRHSMVLTVALLALAGCTERAEAPAPVSRAGLTENPGAGVVNIGPTDTVYRISQRYRLPMADIITFNNLQPPFELPVGSRLRLPPPRDYTVRGGDTVYSVAGAFAVSESQLVVLNAMQPPYQLRPGQQLRLPAANQSNAIAGAPSLAPTAPVLAPTTRSVQRLGEVPPPLPGPKPIANQAAQTQPSVVAQPAPAVPVTRPAPATPSRVVTAPAPPAAAPVIAAPAIPVPDPRPSAAPAVVAVTPAPAPAPPPVVAQPAPAPQRQAAPPPQPAQTAALPPRTGKFTWPLTGRMISGFGPKGGGRHNDGINIAAPSGTAVRAAERGVVAYAGNELRGFGNLLLIRHADGWMTAYAHLDRLLIGRGERVEQGATIGTVGSTGSVDRPQLHFEIRRGSQALDPMIYLPREISSLTR
ncbi:MAG: LysM peptidoglycan-binding domain-containing M23 family metallopeptidase [Alphaproteobacteria bacterium]|nr:LysM peptidoglycan-binding domain-containing M23 family metallopeptidase [Alphaproteobacteria bacterium SS10]